jgi:3-hydroxyacyl-[acyl-carrier-protein] dehydratase
MRFTLLDRIVQLEPGAQITAMKCLSLAEEYLGDHFPLFPVMPGVLMLEAMTQAGAWLVRAGEDFAHSIVVLKEARNVKFSNFVAPGQTLTVTAEIMGQDERQTKLKAQGVVDGEVQLSGRLVLERYNLAEAGLGSAAADLQIKQNLKKLFALLYRDHAQV